MPRQNSAQSNWPMWPPPSDAEVLKLAKLASKFFRFIHPNIVKAVVDDTEQYRSEWREGLRSHDISPETYLWEGSPCVFPGIRRHAGSKEIAIFKGKAERGEEPLSQALQLDDNDFPKQVWSFVFQGRKFSKSGPSGYALAHLADHKEYKNRFEEDFDVVGPDPSPQQLFGLYTSVANTAYVPTNLMKPTDFAGDFRNLLMRKADSLYGDFCNLLPPWLRIRDSSDSDWAIESFEWAEPVGTLDNIEVFLSFRNDTINRLMLEQ